MDWSEPAGSDYGPGFFLAEVRKCEVKVSKKGKGDPYFNLELHDADSPLGGGGTLICWDILMCAGAGRGLGQAKLQALGFEKGRADINPEDLVGRRAWIKVDSEVYKGKSRLKVVSEFEPEFSCGYWNEKSPPEGAASPIADLSSDPNIPF